MKRKVLIISVLMMGFSKLVHAQNNCQPIETTDPKGGYPITAKDITQPGEYCLQTDVRSPKVFVFSEGGERSYAEYMLAIKTSNVVVNLLGFTMNVDARGVGGVRSGFERKGAFQRYITVQNGAIRTKGQSAILFTGMSQMSSLLSDFEATYSLPGAAERNFQETLKVLPQSALDYPKSGHVVEHMRVEAQTGIAVIGMQGAGNVIRNSTIFSENEHTAIYLFGPNQVIENNVIIFKKPKIKTPASTAPIKLHQADGTVIRNNDIIIEGSDDDVPKAAISLIDSKNVIAENNRIYGIKTLAHAWDDKSNLIDRHNEFRSMLRRPLPGAEPGVRP